MDRGAIFQDEILPVKRSRVNRPLTGRSASTSPRQALKRRASLNVKAYNDDIDSGADDAEEKASLYEEESDESEVETASVCHCV